MNEVRRADEMERKLKFLETEIKKDGIKMHEGADSPDAPPPREMSDLESTFEKLEQELQEVSFFILLTLFKLIWISVRKKRTAVTAQDENQYRKKRMECQFKQILIII